jgi:hypothetical protein
MFEDMGTTGFMYRGASPLIVTPLILEVKNIELKVSETYSFYSSLTLAPNGSPIFEIFISELCYYLSFSSLF